ncbi:MAG: hypothetical protein KAG94_05765 [Clostridiales bacterium]|nr:hypothetical protein [Clostridiales bacterium]
MGYKRASIISLIFITAFAVIMIFSVSTIQTNYQENQTKRVENAIKLAIVQCYALEGSYPPSVTYLSENYGIILNEEKYIYHYEVYVSNMMPVLSVIMKNNGDQ